MKTLFLVVELVLATGLWAFLFTWLFRDTWAKGTKPRFILRSVRRPTQYMALAYTLMRLGITYHEQDWFFFGLNVFNTIWISISIWQFNNEDEDDIWKRGKKWAKKVWGKLKSKAREFKPVLVPRPVPIPVGGAA